MWVTLLSQMLKVTEKKGINNYASFPSCEGKSYSRITRRIVSSEDLGVVLMGALKVSIGCAISFLNLIICNY